MPLGDITKIRREHSPEAISSILIPTWNNLPFLQLCIHSIRKNSGLKHQVIVHVNEGNDGTLDWLKSQPDISYTHSAENIGVCYALNAARGLVSTAYIIYLNDDMYVCPGWDTELFREIKEIGHHRFFLSATSIEPVPQSNCSIKGDYGRNIDSFKEEELLENFARLEMADWTGATWPPNIVHVDTWDLVGGYSIEFSPGMYSDPDFSMKLWHAGIRLFKGIAKSRAYHFGSITTKRVVRNRGYFQFIAKWGFTSSTASEYYLRRGEPYTGLLPEATIPGNIGWKNMLKRLDLVFRKF
ncbi:glycosyltransferase family 2 protein [Flavihumibacter fluvii]|uniref:glycosyltransferase family 2 protein n=1 Tax=Flavihumibacter fluvii TaxID=2838157 RepID=UPI001BDF4F3C|nr:glycosyltransferase [Flavihumibacter fluvii]ULQ51460.1 glycosyltransferase [Flavihumibacter fluvii]